MATDEEKTTVYKWDHHTSEMMWCQVGPNQSGIASGRSDVRFLNSEESGRMVFESREETQIRLNV
jgi:hypothetical protein